MKNLALKILEFIHINDEFSSVRQLEHVFLKCPIISVLPLQKLGLFSLNTNKNNSILLYTDSRIHKINKFKKKSILNKLVLKKTCFKQ